MADLISGTGQHVRVTEPEGRLGEFAFGPHESRELVFSAGQRRGNERPRKLCALANKDPRHGHYYVAGFSQRASKISVIG